MMIEWTIIFALIWYLASVGFSLFLQEFLSSIRSKEKNISIYTIICVSSFTQNISCLIGIIILYFISRMVIRKKTSSSSHSDSQSLLNIECSNKQQIIIILAGILHSMGTMMMNWMLALTNIPCVHTIRALEPLLASILVCIIPMPSKNDEKHKNNKTKSIGILLILSGVILSTWRSDQCGSLSLTINLGILTNLLMISRNICIQHMSVEHDELLIQIFLYIISTLISFILLIINDFPYLLIKKNVNILCLIGLCSFLYNNSSIIICSRINLVSHSILTMLKRPTLIAASIIYFHSDLSSMMIIGNIIIMIGILFYKTNLMKFLFQSYRRLYLILILNIIIFPIIGGVYLSLSHTNQNTSLDVRHVNLNKDFPLFHWKPNNIDDNFGDKLSHILVKSIVGFNLSVITYSKPNMSYHQGRLLAIGSIFHFACKNDVIWGSGILDPKKFPSNLTDQIMHTLDIRAVRGPRTRSFLISKYNISVPEIYGDPALLLPYYLTSYKKLLKPTISTLLILHYEDAKHRLLLTKLNPIVTIHAFLPWNEMLTLIMQSAFVISTSLHGIIAAEAFGIPARVLKSPSIGLFKFYDYYEGTNRTLQYATTLQEAILMGGEKPPIINLQQLLNAFPIDKFITHEN